MWFMVKPVTVSIDVPQARERVYDFLDVMANHEPFTDHLLRDWELSGPERGVGSKARVHVRAAGRHRHRRHRGRRRRGARAHRRAQRRPRKAGRTAEGTYTLQALPGGGTRISFEYRWITAPLADRLTAPLARAFIRRTNEKAMRRLAEQLPAVDH